MGRCWAASTRFTSCHTGSTSPLTRYSVWMRAPGPARFCAALSYASAHALLACALSSRLYLHQALGVWASYVAFAEGTMNRACSRALEE